MVFITVFLLAASCASRGPFILQAVQAKSGSLLWQSRPGESGALFALVDGMNASTVITNTDSRRPSYSSIFALNTNSGTTRWQNALNGFGGIVAFVYRTPYSDFKQRLCALQADTGTSLWCHDADGFYNWVIAVT